MNIESNIQRFLQGSGRHQGLQPEERYASFDYCYNYFQSFREKKCIETTSIALECREVDNFQSFREKKCIETLADATNMQQSCLQIGFYLASWGMLRGSTFLLQKSSKFYEPLIECIAASEAEWWSTDVDEYTDENLDSLVRCEHQIVKALSDGGRASATLVTKIMLGVYGNVPAFDNYLVSGLGIRWTGKRSLRRVSTFYQENKEAIDKFDIRTLDFITEQKTHRKYSKAKIIDMIGFIEGQP